MDNPALVISLVMDLGIALALGLLIGVERGWHARGEPPGGRVAGLRTFGLLGLLGGLSGVTAQQNGMVFAIILISAAAIALVVGYIRDMAQDDSVSATTTIAGLVTLALGMLATTGHPVIASVTAGIMLALLAMRAELHAWVGSLSAVEVKAVARFALIAIVVWPLLPDRSFGPYDAWNPRALWTVVVLISGLSFVGYVATRRMGEVRGTLATAAAGALVSSTAVTVTLSRRLAAGDKPAPLVAGIAVAGSIMMLRTLALTALLADFALKSLAIIIVPACITAALVAIVAMRGSDHSDNGKDTRIAPHNPFDLVPALGFAALIAVAALFARWATDAYGDHGLATVLAITGAFDVDAAIVTMGGLPKGAVDGHLGGILLAVPILLNSAFKATLAIGIAGYIKGRGAAFALALSTGAGIAALLMLTL